MHHTAANTISPWGIRLIAVAAVVAVMMLLALFTSNSAIQPGALDAPVVEGLDDDLGHSSWAGPPTD